jgi:hypothetical protein
MKKNFLGRSIGFLNNGAAAKAEGRCNYMDEQGLARAAGEMSNFGGYDGSGDPFLEFGGGDAGSFMDSINKGKVYNLRLVNAHATLTLTALLCPGLISTAQGLIAEGAFTSVEGTAGLSGNGRPYSVPYFNATIQRFPTYILGFKLTSTNINQLEENLIISKDNPYRQMGSEILTPGVYASEANPNTGLLTVNYQFQMDNETKISYTVLPLTTVNFIFIIGASLKTTSALTNKVAAASATAVAKNFIGR